MGSFAVLVVPLDSALCTVSTPPLPAGMATMSPPNDAPAIGSVKACVSRSIVGPTPVGSHSSPPHPTTIDPRPASATIKATRPDTGWVFVALASLDFTVTPSNRLGAVGYDTDLWQGSHS